jgi:dienelactone hydrolase
MTPPAPESLFLALEPFPAFGVLHPAAEPCQDVAALLLPPFGLEEMNSHRARRAWAEHLAADGIAALRLDLPGTADSGGGPDDPGLVEAWTGAVDAAARWLRARSGCHRVAAIGIGLGGLMACRAVSAGAPLDHLVLWGVPARGRTLVRELRAFGRLEASHLAAAGAPEPPALPEGAVAVAGYVLSTETRRALEAVEVDGLAGPDGAVPSVLLLGRDGVDADAELRDRCAAAGAAVTASEGRGYGEMVLGDMQAFRVPLATFAAVSTWLRTGAGATASAPAASDGVPAPQAGATAELRTPDGALRETVVALDVAAMSLPGVVAEPTGPAEPLCAVFLDAGSQRRTGPGRMWVDLARRWAARGVPSARLDVAGIGDADGVSLGWGDSGAFYDGRHSGQVNAALDALAARGLPPRFLVVGLCSGANWGFHAAIADPRVVGAVLLNPGALFWNRWTSLALGGRQVRRLAVVTTWARLRAREIGLAAAWACVRPTAWRRRSSASPRPAAGSTSRSPTRSRCAPS